MLLTEKEMTVLKDLQTQEKSCVDKYEGIQVLQRMKS